MPPPNQHHPRHGEGHTSPTPAPTTPHTATHAPQHQHNTPNPPKKIHTPGRGEISFPPNKATPGTCRPAAPQRRLNRPPHPAAARPPRGPLEAAARPACPPHRPPHRAAGRASRQARHRAALEGVKKGGNGEALSTQRACAVKVAKPNWAGRAMAGAKGYKGRRGGPWGPAEWGAAGLGPGKEAGRNAEPLVSAPGITTTPHSSPGGGGGGGTFGLWCHVFFPQNPSRPPGPGCRPRIHPGRLFSARFFLLGFFFSETGFKAPPK